MKRAVLSTIICFAFGACLMAQDLKLNSLECFERQGVNVLVFSKPDHFENYDDWPFLWGQNEGTISGNTQYIIFGSSLKNIVLGVAFKPYHVASDFLAAVCPPAYDFEGNLLGDKAASLRLLQAEACRSRLLLYHPLRRGCAPLHCLPARAS